MAKKERPALNGITEPSVDFTDRDYFAVAALQGLLSASDFHARHEPSIAAKWSYQYADAMLAERAKVNPPAREAV